MSVSEKQLIANRKNVKKSTGPKTTDGKTVSSRNSIKHGLHARDIIIDSPGLKEDKAEYDLLLDSLYDDLKPVGLFQEYLVRKIANCLWRCRRAVIAETAAINRQLKDIDSHLKFGSLLDQMQDEFNDPDDPPETPESCARDLSDRISAGSIPDRYYSQNILRYEMRLDRQLTRAYRLLRQLQLRNEAESLQNLYNEKVFFDKTNPFPDK